MVISALRFGPAKNIAGGRENWETLASRPTVLKNLFAQKQHLTDWRGMVALIDQLK